MFKKNTIPSSYDLVRGERTTVALKHCYGKTMVEMGIVDPDRFFQNASEEGNTYTGRGTVKILTVPGPGSERVVVRQYRRGGTIRKLIPDLYLGASRPFRELWLTDQALKRGIPTAEIVAACHKEVLWGLHRGLLVSKEIKNGRDFVTYLEGLGEPVSRERIKEKRNVIAAVGRLVRRMHDAGIFHGDLNLKNILVQVNDNGAVQAYLIDFDKSVIKKRLSERKRRQNLMRLNRSVEKFKHKGVCITRTDALRFLKAYYQKESSAPFEDIFRQLNSQYGRHKYLHRLGKKMLSLLA